jgi:hypothetical protein
MTDPLLEVLKHYNCPRDQYAWQWLMLNFGEIPDGLGEAWEIVPDDLRPELEFFYAQPASKGEQ